jgi:hypothetical protein
MIKSARILRSLVALFIAAPAASVLQIFHFLTWENGKQQAIILGGPSSSTDWQMALVGENTKPLVFKASVQEFAGFLCLLSRSTYRFNCQVRIALRQPGLMEKCSVVAGVQDKAARDLHNH